MNQIFDFNRWLLLVGKHWSENRRKYLLSLSAIGGLILVWYVFALMLEPSRPIADDSQITTYYVGLFGAGCLFGSLLFSELASGPKAMNFLAVPASHFEKLLVALLYGVLLFFVVYTAIFYIVDATMVSVANAVSKAEWNSGTHGAGEVFVPEKIANVFAPTNGDEGVNPFFYILLCYFAVQSAFILGSVYFAKYSLIKTVIVGVLVVLFFAFLIGEIFQNTMPKGVYYNSLTSWRQMTNIGDSYQLVKLPSWIGEILFFIAKYTLAPIFWITAYFRLKEKEI